MSVLKLLLGRGQSTMLWADPAPARAELFGIERLENHAISLAAAQGVTKRPPLVLSLQLRLRRNADVLLAAYRASAAELAAGRTIVPAAEWLLDNYYLVEAQVRAACEDLPPGYYAQLPKLADGPFAGYPRTFGLIWAYVTHTDSHFDPETLRRYLAAYQSVQPLTIGELWAVSITLRIVLVENLRRLVDQMTIGTAERAEADRIADGLLGPQAATALAAADDRTGPAISEVLAAQLAKRLRDLDPLTTPALGWLEQRLAQQDSTPDLVVTHAMERQVASNVSVRNVITSMRLITDIDWSEIFEAVSQVEARFCQHPGYDEMDFASRNLYRSAVERLSRRTPLSENQVAEAALAACADHTDSDAGGRRSDPGFHLIAEGRPDFERQIGFRPPLRLRVGRAIRNGGIGTYIGVTFGFVVLLLGSALWALAAYGAGGGRLILWALVALVPATEVARALIDRAVALFFDADRLPGMELKSGVPTTLRTMVVMPTLLTGAFELHEQIDRLEVHHLSGAGGDLTFALLTDGMDAPTETTAGDAPLLAFAAVWIAALNARHPAGPAGPRFLHLHRHRRFNRQEGVWMGWERKRGKLAELNRLLRGANDTSYATPVNPVPADVRYVITLDADTRMPRDAALAMVGKLAHPLNRAVLDPAGHRVVKGYGILQPRVTPSLPLGSGSLYQRVTSGPAGMDPYAAAVSDVYQDLFGEGSYCGKGIYDVDAFEAALAGRIPENTLLSHDLFEGIFARAGLVSDIELIEDFPARLGVAVKRQHRWTRGDWQLLPWLTGRAPMPPLGRAKMLDTLRRSLLAPFTMAALFAGWLLPYPAALAATLFALAGLAIPAILPVLFAVAPAREDVRVVSHLRALAGELGLAALQTAFSVVFLADTARRMGDAILRTLIRLFGTRKHLLEWTTAAATAEGGPPTLRGYIRMQSSGMILALCIAAWAFALEPASWPLILPVAVLWFLAPFIARGISHEPAKVSQTPLSAGEVTALRHTARRTWRFFETFVGPEDNALPPDNFQWDPVPVVAHRTSPTNIGLYLLSCVAARDFGWTGLLETADRLTATLATMQAMPRYRGHFYNWYDTQTLAVLPPAYISSVDSGNLAGHLIAVANACEEWAREAEAPRPDAGLADQQALLDAAERSRADPADVPYWAAAIARSLAEFARDDAQGGADLAQLADRLTALGVQARSLALGMDYTFLMDPERKLLSIGYATDESRLDPSCYDLLASEARLASFFAIAKGDAPTRHWFRLGRSSTAVGAGSALLSWSGSMFEYLMPLLVMDEPFDSLLAQTNRRVVERQRSYAAGLGLPWGISESALNARDLALTYQYSNFGVPGLGLKRGLADNRVIAPYATGLATMVDPAAACANFSRLDAIGALSQYGFCEALDFTASRRPEGTDVAIVQSVMAHHQGMTIVAIANALHAGRMRARFHREPIIKAAELLLQERNPRDMPFTAPRAEEVQANVTPDVEAQTLRRYAGPVPTPPVTHLLSNGRYGVMLTAAGGGYSRWGDIAITRWREDATRDNCGSFIYLQDSFTGAMWSATPHPLPHQPDDREVQFREDRAEYIFRDKGLTSTLDVLVSGEDDGEVRRISLSNTGRRLRTIDVTSCAELVLTTAATDAAHPAFAKMFVQTEYLPEFGALVATRRPRSPGEPPVWAAHFAVVEGEEAGPLQFETDRARFIGRGHGPGDPKGLSEPLSGTVGTVLDPIFALRLRVKVAPGTVARIAFWTVVSSSREDLIRLIDRHNERNAFDRARTLSWTQAQVQLRHLDVDAQEAADFQRLAAPILYADSRYRASRGTLLRGAGPQSGLWGQAVSGDLPIVLLRIDDLADIAQVYQLLRAHEYWHIKRLAVDLVILNEHPSSYVQDLQTAIETAVRSSQSRPHFGQLPAQGVVHVLRADLMGADTRDLLCAVARVVLLARRGPIEVQMPPPAPPRQLRPQPPLRLSQPVPRLAAIETAGLEFFNGIGGFAKDGREYVTILDAGVTTPAPWINVIANAGFGFQVSATGSGFVWAENSRENQLTPWSNDPVSDPSSDAFYVRDQHSGAVFSPTAQPLRDGGRYVARHGFGYSRFEHTAEGIAMELLQFVPTHDPIRISRLTLRNLSGRARRLSVTAYADWVLGPTRASASLHITTEHDGATGAIFARNPFGIAFPGRVAFADLSGQQTEWTADRAEFLGHCRGPSSPEALMTGARLSGAAGAGFDPCAAMARIVDLAPGTSVEVVAFLGQTANAGAAQALIARYRAADLDAVLAEVTAHWGAILGAVQVKTPDRAMDIMLNGWLMYQTIACRINARAGFYQASGAYGFRDQLQDGMALSLALPAETRAHLLRAAGRQFPEGDVQHWWLPSTGMGVRTRISDDRVWLAYAVATYVNTSGDTGVLDETIPFIEGPALAAGVHDAFFQPMKSDSSAALFDHCAKALDQCLTLTGAHGLPLIGTGDWNDGMNRVGEAGRGESVWLGWFLLHTLGLFARLADTRDPARAAVWRAHAATLKEAMNRKAWDGAWYRRATYDDGSWLGTAEDAECRIDSIAQSWAVLSGAAPPARAATAMQSLDSALINRADGLALLFTPPFDTTAREPGYIKGYPPGLRENGGQYSHAAMWTILAFAKLGDGARAAELFALVNPINHARTPAERDRYKVEPYVIAADVYSVAPHVGRGGWTWYTGSAAWMSRAGIEGILGISREAGYLAINPCLPPDWPGFSARVESTGADHAANTATVVSIEVVQGAGTAMAVLDGAELSQAALPLRIPLDGQAHHLRLCLGPQGNSATGDQVSGSAFRARLWPGR